MQNKDHTSEERVLGGLCLLGDGNSQVAHKVMQVLKPANFQHEYNRLVYKTILELHEAGKGFDPFILESRLKDTEEFNFYGGVNKLLLILEETTTNSNLVEYAEIVKESSIERFAEKKLFEAIQSIKDKGLGSISERLGLVGSLVSNLQENTLDVATGLTHIKEIANSWVEVAERRQKGEIIGFTTGVPSIDKVMSPANIPGGSLFVVGARPKMGKTSFLARIMSHFANQGHAVAGFNLEMPNLNAYERLLATETEASMSDLYNPRWSEETCNSVFSGTARLSAKKIYMDDKPGITLSYVQRESRNLNQKEDVKLICIDYLTLMEGEKAERNDLAYGKITKGLKNLAKELNCVVLLLTQLNRQLENRPDKRPYPSDSRDTGQIEQDCDQWVGLYREAVYNENCDDPNLTEAIVRLNRHGGTGTGYLSLEGGVFRDVHFDRIERLRQIEENRPISSNSF